MEWQNLQQWLDTLDGDEVSVNTLLEHFEFPEERLKGYVHPSGEPTVAVSHLQAVAERYGDGEGGSGPKEASDSDDGGSRGLKIGHNTTVPREYEPDDSWHTFYDETFKPDQRNICK